MNKDNYRKGIMFFCISAFLMLTVIAKAQQIKPVNALIPEGVTEEKACAQKSGLQQTESSGLIECKDKSAGWNVKVTNFEKSHKVTEEVAAIKAMKLIQKQQAELEFNPEETEKGTLAVTPSIISNFEGNWFDGYTPPDNTMAISNGGYIVSCVNSNMEYYNTSGSYLWGKSYYDFFNDASLSGSIYDPVVIYDSGADRFVMVVLHGSSSSQSKVIVCFSKSNDPNDGWWYYKLNGNPLNNGCWFDYPKLAVSNNEVYVTGNLFTDGGSFNQAIIYQITKSTGYSGGSLNWQYWHNINGSPFTIVPVSSGQQGNYGPGVYLVSQNSGNGNSVNLFDLTDDLTGSPQINRYNISKNSYSPAGDAMQSGSSVLLDNGDCRILNGFYLNGFVHYVFHSDFQNSGYSGINYNRINVSAKTNTNATFGLSGYDYSYPSVASFSNSNSDHSVMIGFARSGSSLYPEIRVVNCDNNMSWSSSVQVKAGSSYVNANASGGKTRWGDYSGISRKHNTPYRVWLSGGYGTTRNLSGTNYRCLETWIAQIGGIGAGVNKEPEQLQSVKVFPNPSNDMFTLEFRVEKISHTKIDLYNINGVLVRKLFEDRVKPGRNLLTFNKGVLESGTYFITIVSDNQIIKNEKIIITD
jgi:hypothetical protein